MVMLLLPVKRIRFANCHKWVQEKSIQPVVHANHVRQHLLMSLQIDRSLLHLYLSLLRTNLVATEQHTAHHERCRIGTPADEHTL